MYLYLFDFQTTSHDPFINIHPYCATKMLPRTRLRGREIKCSFECSGAPREWGLNESSSVVEPDLMGRAQQLWQLKATQLPPNGCHSSSLANIEAIMFFICFEL